LNPPRPAVFNVGRLTNDRRPVAATRRLDVAGRFFTGQAVMFAGWNPEAF
jgi:hypothetical protein